MAYRVLRCPLYPGISFPCNANASRVRSNFSISWRFCVASGGSTPTSVRFFSNRKESSSADVFSLLLSRNSPSEINRTSAMGSHKKDGRELAIERYNLYKEWLARLMGEDPKKFDKSDLKRAIKYLFPSGLYAKDSRPLLQDPREIFESSDAYMLSPRGRPFSAAFYTGRVGFHDLLYEIYEEAARLDGADTLCDNVVTEQALGTIEDETLDALEEEIAAEQALIAGEDEMPEEEEEWEVKVEDELGTNEGEAWQPGDEELPEDITPGTSGEKSIMEAMIRKKLSRRESGEAFDPTNRGTFRKVIQQDEVAGILDTSAEESTEPSKPKRMRWMSKDELQRYLRDFLTDKEYEMIIHRLKKLSTHQNAHLAVPFFKPFLHPVEEQVPKVTKQMLNLQGEAFGMGHRKRAIAKVLVKKGSGNVTVNDVPLTQYFARLIDRQQIMFPFIVTNAVCEYDVRCSVIGGGNTGQAGAIRLAISRALLNFNDSYEEPLKRARLLIRDARIKERKKAGQKKARKKFAWVRR